MLDNSVVIVLPTITKVLNTNVKLLLLKLLDSYTNIMKISLDDRFMYNREMKININIYIYSIIYI